MLLGGCHDTKAELPLSLMAVIAVGGLGLSEERVTSMTPNYSLFPVSFIILKVGDKEAHNNSFILPSFYPFPNQLPG